MVISTPDWNGLHDRRLKKQSMVREGKALDNIAFIKARYDLWIWVAIIGVLLFFSVLAILQLAQGEKAEGGIVLGVTGLIALLLWSVLPRGFEIRSDRLRIVLGWPWSLNIPFNNITEVRTASAISALAYPGIRFSTSVRTPVLIRRSKGLSIVVSPQHRQEFIDKVMQAVADYRATSN